MGLDRIIQGGAIFSLLNVPFPFDLAHTLSNISGVSISYVFFNNYVANCYGLIGKNDFISGNDIIV